MIKSRDVIEMDKCPKKGKLIGFGLSKDKRYYNSLVVKNIIDKYNINYTCADVLAEHDAVILSMLKLRKRELELNREIMIARMERFKQYIVSNYPGYNILNGRTSKVTKYNISVDCSFILTYGDNVEIVKIYNKRNPGVSYGGRTKDTQASQNIELYLMILVGESLFPNKNIKATFVFLGNKKDSGSKVASVIDYNTTNPRSVITVSAGDFNNTKMNERIDEAIAGKSICTGKHCANCLNNSLCAYQKDMTSAKVIKTKAKASGNPKFTTSQEKVINSKNGNFRVLAGAGAGKTTCVANRICELGNIKNTLLITFTKKGVQEMKEKILFWTKKNHIKVRKSDLNIFTYNSFGQYIIEKEYKKVGFTKKPKLIDKTESMDIIADILNNNPDIDGLDYVNPNMITAYALGALPQVYNWFETLKTNRVVYPQETEYYLGLKPNIAVAVTMMFNEYKAKLKANNLLDYIDQIIYLSDLVKDPEILKKYGYDYIIVDEFQDSDMAQISILQELAKYPYFKGIMVVGDDSQAIFSWRHAYSDYILEFDKYFNNVQDISLVENFRSSKNICELANRINEINNKSVRKNLIGQFDGPMPEIHSGKWSLVSDMVEDDVKSGIPLSDIAVICRTKSEINKIKAELIAKNIPSIVSVSEYLIDNPAMQMICDFFEFLQNNDNSLYFVEYLKLVDYDTYVSTENTSDFDNYVTIKYQQFLDEWNILIGDDVQLKFLYDKLSALAVNDRAVATFLDLWREKKFKTLSELFYFTRCMKTYHSDYIIDKLEENVDAVTLTTAHSSKGREWNKVYVYFEGFRKNYPSVVEYEFEKNIDECEEERRLLFVAITRAKKELCLIGQSNSSVYKEIAMALRSI